MAFTTNGIGSTTVLLDVNTEQGLFPGDIGCENQELNTTSSIFKMAKSRAGGVITSGDRLGLITFGGFDGTDYLESAWIGSWSSGTIGNDRIASELRMYTHPDSVAASPTLRMTIAPTGAVTIATPDSGTGLTVSGGGITATVGNIAASSGSVSASTTVTAGTNLVSTAGDLLLPAGNSTRSTGAIKINSAVVFNNYGTRNIFLAEGAGGVAAFTAASVQDNVGIGYNALNNFQAGNNPTKNTCVGAYSGASMYHSNCIGNTGAGYQALNATGGSGGGYNTALGFQSMARVQEGTVYSVALGYQAGYNIIGAVQLGNIHINHPGTNNAESNTLRIGTATGTGNQDLNKVYISGIYTTAAAPSGTAKVTLTDSNNLQYGLANTTGAVLHVAAAGTAPIWSTGPTITDLTLTGVLNLPTTTSTVGQIKINSAAWAHAYGTANTWLGGAGNFTLTTANAVGNTGIGANSLVGLTGTGAGKAEGNGGLGYGSGQSITDGSHNSLLGYASGNTITTGNYNTCCGSSSGYNSLTTGSYNTFLGAKSGEALTTTDSSNILIGYNTVVAAGSSNVLKIGTATGTGNGEINLAMICGISGATSTSGVAVYINASNVLGTSTSNRDSKQDIADMGKDSSIIYNLRPRTFKFKGDTDPRPKQFGLIAEEVEEVFPDMVIYDKEGKAWNLAYQFLAPMLVNEIQKLQKRIIELENRY
jgi:hypothetical protein